ncbi:MAG: laccase domain-containing protein [Microbacteriaceae bacterium]|jgi:copper oxidase (laccase) domain-containing protein|nr:laccase domain-containing protein [Microbacteriaceae bacterium]MCI1207658.1 laccase domain-containing protein [Microbacteriaceae bacterium]
MRDIDFAAELRLSVSEAADGTMKSAEQPNGYEGNRSRFLSQIGASEDQTVRVHISYDRDDYCRYAAVSEADGGAGILRDVPVQDGLATDVPGLTLFLPLADCMGTVLWDPVTTTVMLTHLGRHSVVQDGAIHSVEFLREHFDVHPEHLRAWLGPSPSGASYPLHDRGNRSFTEEVAAQLERVGVSRKNIVASNILTDRDPDFFSHSEYLAGRQPTDGRHAMAVRIL